MVNTFVTLAASREILYLYSDVLKSVIDESINNQPCQFQK